jgi:hypothetical protein
MILSASVPAMADWNRVGSVKFLGTGSQDFMVPATAHGMTTVGLRPEGDSARCMHVTATFANGEIKELRLSTATGSSSGRGQFLPAGEVATISVPDAEDMTQLQLDCHAESGLRVTIDILAS